MGLHGRQVLGLESCSKHDEAELSAIPCRSLAEYQKESEVCLVDTISKAWGGAQRAGDAQQDSATLCGELKSLSLHRLTASVMEGSTVLYAAEVRPSQREGTYEVSFKPEISGVYGLALCLEGGRHLKGSPFAVRAKTDETVAANCKMYGAGLTRAVAGQATTFTIQGLFPAINSDSNSIQGLLQIEAEGNSSRDW